MDEDSYEIWEDADGVYASFDDSRIAEDFLEYLSSVRIGSLRIPIRHPFSYSISSEGYTVMAPELFSLGDYDEEWMRRQLENYQENEPNERVIL